MPEMSNNPVLDSRVLQDLHVSSLSNEDLLVIRKNEPVNEPHSTATLPPHAGDNVLRKPLMSVPSGRPRGSRKLVESESKNVSLDNEDPNPLGIDFTDMLTELRTELDVKRREEASLQRDIADTLSQSTSAGSDLSRSFGLAVSRLNNSLLLVETDTKQLANSLKVISKLADNISSKVSALDVAKTRVVECLQLAGDMRDLGVCSEGVDACISEEEYEQAAQHIHRFLTLDKAVFQLRDSVDKEAGQSVKHSYDVLTAAAARLKEIFERRLSDAVERKDIPTMHRFVRLFPLINEHMIGLEIFGRNVVGDIAKLGEDAVKVMLAGGTDDSRRNVLYADTMFLFFESIANVVESNQPLIENSYGSDRLLDFIQMLQSQIDKTVDLILTEFIKRRNFDRSVKAVEKFLLDPHKTQEKPNALELDVVLSEVAQMHTRAEMYWRFLKRRIGEDKAPQEDDEEDDADTRKRRTEERRMRKERREQKLDALLNRSIVGTRMQELMGRYIQMEQFYMLQTVEKAITMDQREEGQLTSSVVDDVLFIVRKCVRRALSTSSVDGTCATLNNGCALLETNFHAHIAEAIKDGYPSVGYVAEAFQTAQTAYNVLQHGKTVSEAGPDAQRELFITAVNNARAGAEMVGELKRALSGEVQRVQRAAVENAKLEHSVSQLDEASAKMKGLADKGIQALTQAAFRPKLRTSCEQYLELNHTLTDEQLAGYEASDPWVEGFIALVDRILAGFQTVLHQENYSNLLLSVCSEVCKQWERVLFKCTFNRLGGLQLDKEFRMLTGYLSGVAGWSARERCSRVTQIVALLNVDSLEEAVELCAHSSSASLAEREVKRTLLLRVDLPETLVNRLSI